MVTIGWLDAIKSWAWIHLLATTCKNKKRKNGVKMKKLSLYFIIVILWSSGLFADGVQPTGSGTETDPYQVETLDNLLWISTNDDSWGSHFVQTANIDATDTQNWNDGEGFSPIGITWNNYFTGTINGQDHTIDGLYINRSSDILQGLFGYVVGAMIENLGIINIDVSGNDLVGGLVALIDSTSSINNCYSSGDVNGNNEVGGIVGSDNSSSIVSNCYSACNVNGNDNVGGIIGIGSLSNCHNTGNINGNENVGGVVGKGFIVSSCFNTGSVVGNNHVGGLVGWNRNIISNCYSTGNVNGNSQFGGLVGFVDYGGIQVSNSYYNYDTVLINGVNAITIGALDNELYTEWFDNDLVLNIDEHLTLNGSDYQITNVFDFNKLLAFGQFEHHFLLTNDIDLSMYNDFYIPYFSGNFDGDNHIIDNLTVNLNNHSNIGLFGFTSEAIIENVGVTNVDINGDECVGGLMGTGSTINNCYSTGSVVGNTRVGGLVGTNSGSISNSSSSGTVIGEGWLGGLAGWNYYGTSINSCYSSSNVSGTDNYVGGLVGNSGTNSTVTDCYSIGNMSGEYAVGGLVGSGGTISNCYSTGSVTGDIHIGGLVGSGASISNSYSTSNVNGNIKVGGLMGFKGLYLSINNCYSTGLIVGNSDVGGLIGNIVGSIPVLNSFWNIETSGQTTSAGGTGKTTAEMQNVATYTSLATVGLDEPWDFIGNPFDDTGNEDFWDIDGINNDGYPFLTTTPLIGIDDEVVTEIPEVSKLLDNYPNPFNPTTTISFSIPKASEVELAVFNIKGQKVRTLTNAIYSIGDHYVIWNGVDESGKSISSGVYFYKLNVNGKPHSMKKCILLK